MFQFRSCSASRMPERWRARVLGALGLALVGLLAALALTGALEPRDGAVELLDAGCEAQMAAAASALGWDTVEAYKKNLRAEGKPVDCSAPAAAPAAPQMHAAGGAKLAAGPHPVQQHSDNIIKWMFGDLFDDHPSHSLHPTALHLAGHTAAQAPKPAAPVVRRADGSRVRRTAAERRYDNEQHELRVEEREERQYRAERREHAELGSERHSEMEREEARVKREAAKVREERAVLQEREARVARTERKEDEERRELRQEEARAAEGRAARDGDEATMRDARQRRPETKPLPPTRQLAKALEDAGNMWGDKPVPVPGAQAPARPAHHRHDDTRSVEAVKTMAEEAKALGYKLVPAGLEKQAQEMGYDIVPSRAAPAPADGGLQLGAAMRAQEGSEMSPSQPGTLEVLAERDVEHQLAELTRSRTAKRLEKQVRARARARAHTHTHIHMHAYMHAHMHTHMHAWAHGCVCVLSVCAVGGCGAQCLYARVLGSYCTVRADAVLTSESTAVCVCICIHIHTCIYTFTYTYTFIHAYIHTYIYMYVCVCVCVYTLYSPALRSESSAERTRRIERAIPV